MGSFRVLTKRLYMAVIVFRVWTLPITRGAIQVLNIGSRWLFLAVLIFLRVMLVLLLSVSVAVTRGLRCTVVVTRVEERTTGMRSAAMALLRCLVSTW